MNAPAIAALAGIFAGVLWLFVSPRIMWPAVFVAVAAIGLLVLLAGCASGEPT